MSQVTLDMQSDADAQQMIMNALQLRMYLTGEITIEKATELCEALYNVNDLNLQAEDPKPIKLIINSPGGDLASSQMICDVINDIETEVHGIGLGQVCSGGFMVFMACKKGERSCSKYTQFMSHRFSTSVEGSHTDLKIQQLELDRMHSRILEHYCNHTHLTPKKVEELLLNSHNVWLTAEDCINLGVVDYIIKGKHDRKLKRNIKTNNT